jgi:hypothetical protein
MRSRRHLQVFLGPTRLDVYARLRSKSAPRPQSLLELGFPGSYYIASATPKVAFGLMDCLLYFVDKRVE